MTSVEQRVSFIEGKLDQFSTKPDLAELESRLIKWMVTLQLLGLGAIAGIVAAIVQLFG